MAGFGKVSFVGEYYGQAIVNTFWYRSATWVPAQGNPFDDVLAFVDAVIAKMQPSIIAALPTNYTLLRAEGVGYADDFSIVTSAPLVRTIGATGTQSGETTGAIICGNVGLRCGEQVQINLLGKSKRNRGYLAIGPVLETYTDNYGHLTVGYMGYLNSVGAAADDTLTIIAPAVSLIPIRIHEKFQVLPKPLKPVLLWRTYSDVQGFTVPRKFGTRKSRHTEA